MCKQKVTGNQVAFSDLLPSKQNFAPKWCALRHRGRVASGPLFFHYTPLVFGESKSNGARGMGSWMDERADGQFSEKTFFRKRAWQINPLNKGVA